ncbi:MAG: hypothetical protein FOGNACKC_05533 [Anaerolineae bacterium]|nr:hypothetical protein [Anaerolineae bacterium]
MNDDKLDRFLTWGATPDWISPLLGLIRDFTNGPHYNFYPMSNTF